MIKNIFKTYKLWWIASTIVFLYFAFGFIVAFATPWSYLYDPFSGRFFGNLCILLISGGITCLSTTDGSHLKKQQ